MKAKIFYYKEDAQAYIDNVLTKNNQNLKVGTLVLFYEFDSVELMSKRLAYLTPEALMDGGVRGWIIDDKYVVGYITTDKRPSWIDDNGALKNEYEIYEGYTIEDLFGSLVELEYPATVIESNRDILEFLDYIAGFDCELKYTPRSEEDVLFGRGMKQFKIMERNGRRVGSLIFRRDFLKTYGDGTKL